MYPKRLDDLESHMIPSALELRLQQLESRVLEIGKLLNEYEEELLDEDDPKKKRKYRRQLEDLKQQKAAYESEFFELDVQLKNETSIEAQVISSQLKEIDNKIEFLLDGQYAIGTMLSSHFVSEDEKLLRPVMQQLNSFELVQVESCLRAVENNQISERETQLVLTEMRNLVAAIKSHNGDLPENERAILNAIESPKIETKHALKLSIPIIPFILSYEGDLGVGAGVDLKKLWRSWKA